LEREEWTVTKWKSEPQDWVRAGDKLIPDRVAVTIRQSNQAPRHQRRPDAELVFEVRAGGVGCTSFTVTSRPGDRMIQAADLVTINLDAFALAAFGHFAQPFDAGGERSTTLLDRALVETREGTVTELRDVARVYLDPINRSKPVVAVKNSKPYPTITTANRRVRAARDRGLIPPVGATRVELEAAYKRLKEGNDDGEEG
jgi:hypothetical protein